MATLKNASSLLLCILLFVAAFAPFFCFAQSTINNCSNLKSGVFHFYPKNTNEHIIIYIEGDKQIEINPRTNDTTFSEVVWSNNCSFTQKFISSTSEIDKKTTKFLKKHILAYKVEEHTDEYYTVKGYIDKLSGTLIQSDTIWLVEKIREPVLPFIEQITTTEEQRLHIKDTSSYALLYIYRPGKLTNSLSNYPVYINDNPICVMKNKSGFIFKIYREGEYVFTSSLLNNKSAVTLNIEFGKKYYLKSMIHWGMYRGLANYKLEMAVVPNTPGAEEFSDGRK